MSTRQVLLTGDYWHADFADCIQSIDVPVTMVPMPRLVDFLEQGPSFDLIIVAQSRRGQLTEDVALALRQACPSTPIVALLGSWCEGEERSGTVLPGIIRVYWHQWRGRMEHFVQCLEANGVSNWHHSPLATRSDIVLDRVQREASRNEKIGVSAWTLDQYEMLADALQAMGWQTVWVERVAWQAEPATDISAVVVDGNSVTPHLVQRIDWIRQTFGNKPMLLVLNFPRSNEADKARECQIEEVVSKPFELNDLGSAVARTLDRSKLDAQRSTIV